jgi:hypothetical protein
MRRYNLLKKKQERIKDIFVHLKLLCHHVPVILTTQETEIRRIEVRSHPWKIVLRDPISKNPSQK